MSCGWRQRGGNRGGEGGRRGVGRQTKARAFVAPRGRIFLSGARPPQARVRVWWAAAWADLEREGSPKEGGVRARLRWARWWCMGTKPRPCNVKGEERKRREGGLTPGHAQERGERGVQK
jgi:hypothetical protein